MLCILLASVDSPQDKRKLELLYEKYNRLMYVVAMRVLHHPQDAEDAVSEAVLSAYENIHKLRKEEAFRSWIFQILANVCRRKLKSRERTETELKEDHASATYCDGLRTDVERAFLILDEDDQLIIGLSVYGGYNSKEIGEMLKMNPNTVRSRRKRALEKMSWLLKE